MNIAKHAALLVALFILVGCSELKPFDGQGSANAVPALKTPADLTPIKMLDTYQVPAAAAASAVAP